MAELFHIATHLLSNLTLQGRPGFCLQTQLFFPGKRNFSRPTMKNTFLGFMRKMDREQSPHTSAYYTPGDLRFFLPVFHIIGESFRPYATIVHIPNTRPGNVEYLIRRIHTRVVCKSRFVVGGLTAGR